MLKRSECDGGRVASPPLHANSKSLATVHDLTSGALIRITGMQYFSSLRVLAICCVFTGSIIQVAGQQSQSDPRIDEAMRAAIIEGLVSKIEAAYAVPEAGQRAIRDLRAAMESHAYDGVGTAREFAGKLTSELRASTRDKHIAVYFDPAASMGKEPAAATTSPREHFNFGFIKSSASGAMLDTSICAHLLICPRQRKLPPLFYAFWLALMRSSSTFGRTEVATRPWWLILRVTSLDRSQST